MHDRSSSRLVILTGPSGVGKSPLVRALRRHEPALCASLEPVVLFNSRAPRPGEQDGVDYHFRSRAHIESLRASERMVVMDVRGDLQALDLDVLSRRMDVGDAIFEGNPFVGRLLLTHPSLATVPRLGIFLSPLSREEIISLRTHALDSLVPIVIDIMRRKLLRRTRKQRGELSLTDLQNVETRAASAIQELRMAHEFPHVVVNHDGEDSENWDAFYYLIGDARRTLMTVTSLLRGELPAQVERWAPDLVPAERGSTS